MSKAEQSPPEDDDDWDERLGDLWSMTAKEHQAFFNKTFYPILLIVFAIAGFVIYREVAGNAEKHVQKRPAAPFTWPPPETYDSSSLKR